MASRSNVGAEVATRERVAWVMYDFANSGYTTVVLTAIFNAYFVSVVAGGAGGFGSGGATFLWTLTIALGNAFVLLSAPVLGAIADYRAAKKPILLFTTIACVVSTGLLGFVGEGDIALGIALVVVSFVMFASGENLIAAFLPEIAPARGMGRLSGYGWGVGYFGGLLTLALCFGYINFAEHRGHGASQFVPVTLVITATVFALAATPTFLWLEERAVALHPVNGRISYLKMGFGALRRTLGEARRFRDLFRFLTALIVIQAGVSTVVIVAAIYAQEVLGVDAAGLVRMLMVVNVAAAAGALTIGHVQDRYGSIRALLIALLVWITAIVLVLKADTADDIWPAASLIGVAMGSGQAAGRALVGRLTPAARTAEFFGLWGFANRLAAILGPVSYGLISYTTGGNQRVAVLSTLAFFVLGLVLTRVEQMILITLTMMRRG